MPLGRPALRLDPDEEAFGYAPFSFGSWAVSCAGLGWIYAIAAAVLLTTIIATQ